MPDRPNHPPDPPTQPRAAVDPLAGLRLDAPPWSQRIEQATASIRESPARLVVAMLAGLLAVALAAWLLLARPASAPPIDDTLPTAPLSSTPAPAPATTASAGSVVAHAAGAVVAPGVYELEASARVADLIASAGGLAPDADGNRLNLAAPVADGTRVYVPRVGEVVPDDVGAGPPPGGVGGDDDEGGSSSAGATPELVDLNRADIDLLDTLPGVGPTTAQAIVDHREQNGPFTRVDELIDVRGIGEAKLAQLRDLVRV